MSDLDDVKLTRARKLHSCEECNALIPSARNYYRHKWLSEYGFRSIAVCVDCQHLAADMFTAGFVGENEDGNDCYPYLPEVDYWVDVCALGGDWPARVDAYLRRLADPWRGALS